MLSDLSRFRPGELRSDLRGHSRPNIAIIVILSSLKYDHFFILLGQLLRPFEAAVSMLNPTLKAVQDRDLKSDQIR